MNKIYSLLLAFATAIMTFTSCSESNDAFFTATENDYPRILNTDIPEGAGGERSALPAISRGNFTFTVIVTPADYTTVTWKIDGAEVSSEYVKNNGKDIEYPIIAGKYDVDIIATTTKGLSTQRLCTLEVLPIDGDPVIVNDDENLWCQIGTKKVLNVSNFEAVASMTIGGQAIPDFKNNGATVEFTVPNLPEGEQNVIVTTADGTKYGCGNVNVRVDKYVANGVQEIVLWEGATDINWGDANISIKAEQLANVKVGDKIKLYYEVPEAEYHAMRITTGWWGDNVEDNLVPQFDITADTPNPYEFEYTEACKALVDERGDMLIVGFGYKVTKVTFETAGAPAEKTVWEGDCTINWGDSNISLKADQFADVKVGSQISIYYDVPEAEYHAMRITTGWWGDNAEDNLVPQFDITADTPNPFVFEYTDACKALVEERGDMLVVGFGYVVKKITVK